MSLDLIDREIDLKMIKDSYNQIFSVITSTQKINYYFYGIPEIGKTRLLEETKKMLKADHPQSKILFLTLTENASITTIDVLLNIRKQFAEECPLFDYALRMYLDYISPFSLKALSEKTNTTIEIAQNATTDTLSLLHPACTFLNCLPIAKFVEYYKMHRLKLKAKNQFSDTFEKIHETFNNNNPLELIQFMPEFLSININEYNKRFRLVMIIDKMEYLDIYPWLVKFVNGIDRGLFIMAGKEKILKYSFNSQPFCKKLQNIPKEYIRDFFEEKMDVKDFSLISKLVSNIKNPSQIEYYYVKYNKLRGKSTSEIEKELFSVPSLNIIPYISYLDKNIQNLIKTLSVLGIFERKLFHKLLGISNIQYFDTISKLTFVEEIYINKYLTLYSIPDEICSTLTNEIAIQGKKEILCSALNIVINNHIGNDITIVEKYFFSFLQKFNSLNIALDAVIIEELLDLFFDFYQSCNAPLFLSKIQFVTNSDLKKLIKYIQFVLYASITSKEIFDYRAEFYNLVKVDYGKHQKSLYLINAKQLCSRGAYQEGIEVFEKTYKTLSKIDEGKWFYGKSVINYGDSLMLKGNFKSALSAYEKYSKAPNECWNFNNNFDERRQRAHTFRFNADWEQAKILYEQLLDTYNFSDNLKSYALVGLCETLCYTNADYIIDNYESIAQLCNNIMNQKSTAKVYYAAGISYTVKKEFGNAEKCIDKSITLNQDASYPSGVLFALIAKCYLEYAQSKTITPATIRRIETLLRKIQVYEFLKLPIYIMMDDKEQTENCEHKFEWLNFEKTYLNINNFLKLL